MTRSPWYRQFWPWFLIAIPATGVVMAVIMVATAIAMRDVEVTRTDEPVLDKTSWQSR
jgi:hypothetical protein